MEVKDRESGCTSSPSKIIYKSKDAHFKFLFVFLLGSLILLYCTALGNKITEIRGDRCSNRQQAAAALACFLLYPALKRSLAPSYFAVLH
jgi:amino acid permease